MSKLSEHNLQEYCRTCLGRLPVNSFSLFNSPDLQKLIVWLTKQEDKSEMELFPKNVCEICYKKLQNFDEFRDLVLSSTQILICLSRRKSDFVIRDHLNRGHQLNKQFDNENELNDDDLLLPEIAPFKAEPIDTDEDDTHIKWESAVNLKIEIDSDFEEEDYHTNFYEKNALGIEDDEHVMLSNDTQYEQVLTPLKKDGNKKSLKCPRCDKQVYKQVYLDAHIRAVHEGQTKPFICVECRKSFTRYNHLREHIQSHHKALNKLRCEYDDCDAAFRLTKNLKTHKKVENFSDSSSVCLGLQAMLELHKEQLSKEIAIDHHICQYCTKQFSSRRTLSEHLKRHLKIKEHICKECGVAKVTRTELLTHMRTHEPDLEKFQCTICPQKFNHKNAIARHIRVVHEGQRRFPCQFCAKRFGTLNSQRCHERLHTGERPFKCQECNKGFAQLEGLKSHMKNHDKSLRTHVCKFCSLRFITRRNLLDHERRHEGYKPYICEICGRGFMIRDDLNRHKLCHVEENINDQQQT